MNLYSADRQWEFLTRCSVWLVQSERNGKVLNRVKNVDGDRRISEIIRWGVPDTWTWQQSSEHQRLTTSLSEKPIDYHRLIVNFIDSVLPDTSQTGIRSDSTESVHVWVVPQRKVNEDTISFTLIFSLFGKVPLNSYTRPLRVKGIGICHISVISPWRLTVKLPGQNRPVEYTGNNFPGA